jgi:tetratricopeptide (TPR) repeat protein
VRGLVGHEVFEGRRLLIDYRGGEVALVRSGRAQRTVNAFQVLLDADEAAWGMSPERWLYRARLRVALGDEAAAAALLDRLLDTSDPDVLPDHAAARVLAAELARRRGDLAAAWHLLAPLSPAELVEQDEIIAVVEGLLLDGHQEEAIDVAEAAVRARPGSATAWVARAAVQRVQGDHDDAYASLQQAALLAGDEDAWLLERARVASARGDLNGALALLRDGMYTNPLDGRLAWFYALVSPPETRGDVITDLNRVEQLAHPKLRPLDFLTGAHHAVADDPRAHQLAAAGATADCSRGAQDQIDNCLAWYGAMVATDLDAALERILRAITARGPDPSLLDTLAMVRLARGERAQALQAATDAVRIAPEDPYLHWQRERIAALAGPAPQATQLDPATASPAGGGAPRGPRLRAPSTGSPRSPSNLTQDPIQAPLHTDTPAIPPR